MKSKYPILNLNPKSMKIGIFSELYTPSIGGMESRHKEIAKALISLGHEVTVYCIGHTKDLAENENIDGVNICRYPIVKNYKEPFIKSLKRSVIPLLRYSFWSSKIQKKENFDFIIYNQWPLFHIVFAPKETRTHSIIDWCEVRNGKLYQIFQKYLPRLSKFNMAVSPSVCDQIKNISGQPVFFFPSGIEGGKYSSLERQKRSNLLCLGRIAEHKNIVLLVEAFELMRDSHLYSGNLVIAGDGPALDELCTRISVSPYKEFIDLLGLVTEEEKVCLLSTSELLVIPSKREGFPQVVAEAMASGLPVVTCEFPENGTASVVEYYGCGLVSKPDPSSLSKNISDTLADWQKYSKICLNASKALDWSILVKSLEQELMSKVKS
jgi:glycosyltransferase involved in cell wall biosynthesis